MSPIIRKPRSGHWFYSTYCSGCKKETAQGVRHCHAPSGGLPAGQTGGQDLVRATGSAGSWIGVVYETADRAASKKRTPGTMGSRLVARAGGGSLLFASSMAQTTGTFLPVGCCMEAK
jgi:hypothetical protein